MKNSTLKRALALLLTATCMLSLFACKPKDSEGGTPGNPGSTGTPGASTGNKAKPTNVWRETPLAVPETLSDAYGLNIIDGKVYFSSSEWDYETQTSNSYVNVYDTATGTVDVVLSIIGAPRDYDQPIYEYHGYSNVVPLSDGSFWLLEENSYENYTDPNMPVSINDTAVARYDLEGNYITGVRVTELFPDMDYVYVNRMEVDAQGNLYVLSNMEIAVLDGASGEHLFTISDDSYIQSLVRYGDGRVAAAVYSGEAGGQVIRSIDPAAKGYDDELPMPSSTYLNISLPGDAPYLFYYLQYNAGLFGLKSDGTTEEIINFLNSDIGTDNINGLLPLGDGDLLMVWYDYDAMESSVVENANSSGLRFSRLTRVPDDEVKEATLLTYACLWLDWNLKNKIMRFNRENEDYRIIIDDYSRFQSDSDWEAGYKRLAADIIMGKVPDIINLDQINAQPLINKGLLADMYALMDASPNHNRDDYEPSVLSAAESNGKLYSFTPGFNVYTVAAKRSLVGDTPGWTLDDLNALLATMPAGTESFALMTKADILRYSLMLGLGQYIDWASGTVDFGDHFIQLLEFANTFPKEINYEEIYGENYDWDMMQNRYRENRTLLVDSYVSGYRDIRYLAENTYSEEVTLIGFPTADKSGSVFMPGAQYAISAKSSPEIQQVCFDFLASLVETEPNFANSGGYFYGSFSLSRNYNEKVRAYELTPLRERPGYIPPENNGDSGIARAETDSVARPSVVMPMPQPGGDGSYDQDAYERNYPLSQYEIDAIDSLIRNTTKFHINDTAVNNIITEETDAYFAGQKSAAEATKQIQSRVAIYVSEQS